MIKKLNHKILVTDSDDNNKLTINENGYVKIESEGDAMMTTSTANNVANSTTTKKTSKTSPSSSPSPKSELKKSNTSSSYSTSSERIYPYRCNVCNKGFKLPYSLTAHEKVHSEERKHVCMTCGNTFKRAEHLRIHINGVHLKRKPYECKECGKTFSQSGDRNIHMSRHTSVKPHKCVFCDKAFRLIKALRAHMRIHTGEKPYSCVICKLDFMTYTSLASEYITTIYSNKIGILEETYRTE